MHNVLKKIKDVNTEMSTSSSYQGWDECMVLGCCQGLADQQALRLKHCHAQRAAAW
jgi:hypothetical protein